MYLFSFLVDYGQKHVEDVKIVDDGTFSVSRATVYGSSSIFLHYCSIY